MLGMNDIRKGKTIVLDGEPYVVTSSSFMRKQKTRPVMRTQLKHLMTGSVREHTWQQADKVEEADIDRLRYQFLYRNGSNLAFMDQVSFEQVELSADIVGDNTHFLLEGEDVEVLLFNGVPVAVDLPIKIDRLVVVAPPGIKGDTSTNVMKEVEIEGGAKVKAPLFIKAGDKIRIDTRTGQYVEKA